MRLSVAEIKDIKDAVYFFDKDAKIYLFGSRTDDNKRGGDIDLLIISKVLEQKDKYRIYSKILNTLEEQKIDIIINDGKGTNYFIGEALKNGLQL